jgi:pimeloyl-ACP methyl ester carboxylesterase
VVVAQVSGEPELQTVTSGTARLAVRRVGAGGDPAVVCLHAGVADSRSWAGLMDALSPGIDVVAYDRRGFGRTTCAAEAHDQVADLAALLDALDLARTVLVGNSLGGQIALNFTLVHPERVAALVLVAPAVSGAPEVQASDLSREESDFWTTLEAADAAGDLGSMALLLPRAGWAASRANSLST